MLSVPNLNSCGFKRQVVCAETSPCLPHETPPFFSAPSASSSFSCWCRRCRRTACSESRLCRRAFSWSLVCWCCFFQRWALASCSRTSSHSQRSLVWSVKQKMRGQVPGEHSRWMIDDLLDQIVLVFRTKLNLFARMEFNLFTVKRPEWKQDEN